MWGNFFNHKKELFTVSGMVILFALIRSYQKILFYDPFLVYFEHDYLYKAFPEYNAIVLYVNLIYRYCLNSIISVVIIYVIFKNISFLKLAALIYLVALIVLLLLFGLAVNYTTYDNYQYLFYVRRFLIQPLLVMLLVPAFYFQKKHVGI